MSLSQRISQVWQGSNYTPPRIPLIFHENEYMATIDDSGTFIRFMAHDGQIFLSMNKNCSLSTIYTGDSVYVCTKVDPILCSPTGGPNDVKDLFVMNKIAPMLA